MRIFIAVCLFVFTAAAAVSQDSNRGVIPEELLRPGKGEAPYYPADTIIGELGRGNASAAAYSFASSAAAAIVTGFAGSPALASVNSAARERHLSAVREIGAGTFRIGGGREEPDGSFSFLVRFLGAEHAVTGEMYVRYVTRQIEGSGGEMTTAGNWVLDDLFLEEARSRGEENLEVLNRSDFNLYERFF